MSCNQPHLEKKVEGEITTFAFDELRSGTIEKSFTENEFKRLKLETPQWGERAVKYFPLYITLKRKSSKKYLIVGTYEKKLKAVDVKNNKIKWEVELPGLLMSTPVFSKKKEVIYALITTAKNTAEAYEFIAINLEGKILDRYPLKLFDYYKKNNPNLTSKQIDRISIKTAVGINEINDEHYIFVSTSTPRNPYTSAMKNESYGVNRGLTGLLIGVYIKKESGLFYRKKEPLLFFTSKITENKLTGFNSGVYLSGGATPVLEDNTLLLATGNGPSFPLKGNYGCSIVRLDGRSFKPLSGKLGYGYLSSDLDGFHECFASNVEFSSSYPSLIKKEDGKYTGFIKDKFGNIFIFDPNKLSGNTTKNRTRIDIENFMNRSFSITYSGGSALNYEGKAMFVFSENTHRSQTSHAPVYATNLSEKELGKEGYVKKECIGLIKRKGKTQKSISLFYSGEILKSYIIANSNDSLVSDLDTTEIYKLSKMKGTYFNVMGQKVGYKATNSMGHDVPVGTKYSKKYYKRTPFIIYAKKFSKRKRFKKITSEYKQDSMGAKSGFIPLYNSFYFLEKVKNQNKDCEKFDHKTFNKLFRFEKTVRKITNSFVIYNLEESTTREFRKRWDFEGGTEERVDKNSLITVIDKKSRKHVTIFHSMNRKTGEAFIYIINSLTGKLVKRYPISGRLHFSSVIPIDEGIVIPTSDRGILILRTEDSK